MKGSDLIHNGEIVLDGTILSSGSEEFFDSGIITGALVRSALAQFSGDVVALVNSPGGDPTEGEAIRSMLVAHPGKVTVRVAGDAASAASLMIMGADRIEMSQGSIIMIHDPSKITIGTAQEHTDAAEYLDVLADTYAGVYATRSGKTQPEMRAIMKAEKWFGPAQAIAEGFADATTGDAVGAVPSAAMISDGKMRHEASLTMMRQAATISQTSAGGSAMQQAAAGGLSQADPAAHQESAMTKPNTAPAANDPAVTMTNGAPATVVMAAGAAQAVPAPTPEETLKDERARMKAIRGMAAPFMASGSLLQADVDVLIDGGVSEADASQRLLAMMASAQAPMARSVSDRAVITRDETETKMEGMIGALMGKKDGPATDYQGLRLKSLAMHLGGSARGFNEADAIKRGMMATSMVGGAYGVSDFSYITTEVMGRTLVGEYERQTAGWDAVTGIALNASDFRELHAVRFGGDFQMKKVLENGEYEEATLVDEAEGLKVERRGRTINITFEAIINDDMGAFQRIPREFARSARLMEASMVWTLIRTNAVLKSDNVALFHAGSHKNLAAAGAVISAVTVGAGRKAMWEQRASGTKDADDFIFSVADRLVVPPALELAAGQFIAPVTPATDADGNPFKATMTPHVAPHLGAAAGGSDTAWYMFSSDLPPVSHAYLDGHEAPSVQTIEGMNPDKVTLNARHIFGAAVTEYRGSYKNPGA